MKQTRFVEKIHGNGDYMEAWEMYEDLLAMFGDQARLENAITQTMNVKEIIVPSEDKIKHSERLQAIHYLYMNAFYPRWLEIHKSAQS